MSNSGNKNMSQIANTDEDHILWLLLRQANTAIFRARHKELNKYDLTPMEAGVLFILMTSGNEATPAEVSRRLFREHHTVGALLSRMEKRGLITRIKDSIRKNIWKVSVTKKGDNAYRQSSVRESIHNVFSMLSDEEHKQLESSLRKLRDHALKQLASQPTIPFP